MLSILDEDGGRPHKKQKVSMESFATLGQFDAYATPEPSHHAAEKPEVTLPKATLQASGLRTPLSELGSGSGPSKVTSKPLATRTVVKATCEHSHNALLKSTSRSIAEQFRHARLSAPPYATQRDDDSSAALAAFARIKPLHLRLKERPKAGFQTKVHLRVESWDAKPTRPDQTTSSKSCKPKKRAKISKTRKSFVVPDKASTTPSVVTVPQFSYCVRLRDNILAPNIKMLHTLPYHGDEFSPERSDYEDYYNIDVDDRWVKLFKLHKACWLFSTADNTVNELGISWQDILLFYFAPIEQQEDPKVVEILQKRHTLDLVDDECPLTSTFWVEFSANFTLDVDRLAKAAYFCEFFQQESDLSAWHVLRRCALVREHFSDDDSSQEECRVCHRFTCHLHGELREHDPDDEGSGSDSDGAELKAETQPEDQSHEDQVQRDLVNPQQVNFRKAIKFLGPAKRHADKLKHDPRKARSYWESFAKPDDTAPLYPCHHPGVSCEANGGCSCKTAGVPCSKYCSCPSSCSRKFQGCLCAARNRKSGEFVCFRDDRCACYHIGRECDPDLCGHCGVCDVLGQAGDEVLNGRCYNASLQRGMAKHTILGRSHVHEYGLYACERMKQHDFIGEYKGEIITKEEANRRGAKYEHQKMSYLFSLNENQEVDSTFFGNKMRFINHSTNHTKNVYAVIMMVNTVHRITMFADRPIEIGEELFFDYGPTFPTEQVGGKQVRKSVPKARNAKLIATFEDTPRAVRTKKPGRPRRDVSVAPSEEDEEVEEQYESEEEEVERGEWSAEELPSAERRLAAYNVSDSSAESGDHGPKSKKRKRGR